MLASSVADRLSSGTLSDPSPPLLLSEGFFRAGGFSEVFLLTTTTEAISGVVESTSGDDITTGGAGLEEEEDGAICRIADDEGVSVGGGTWLSEVVLALCGAGVLATSDIDAPEASRNGDVAEMRRPPLEDVVGAPEVRVFFVADAVGVVADGAVGLFFGAAGGATGGTVDTVDDVDGSGEAPDDDVRRILAMILGEFREPESPPNRFSTTVSIDFEASSRASWTTISIILSMYGLTVF